MPTYRVSIEADFELKVSSREVAANRVRTMIKAGKFDERNFEWGVQLVRGDRERQKESVSGVPSQG